MKFNICNIKRNPVCEDKETYKGRVAFYEKIRIVCKELIEDGEYANAANLYSRVRGDFLNMEKKMKDSLNETEAS